MTEREKSVSLADQLREQAAGYRRVYDNYGLKLDCSTINGALEYGRAQGMEMAADYLDRLPAPTPPCGGQAVTAAEDRGDGDEPFAPSFYQQLREHAWTALRECKPFQINADGAIAIIEQAASDHADNVALRAENYRLTALVSRLEKQNASLADDCDKIADQAYAFEAKISRLEETIRADGEALKPFAEAAATLSSRWEGHESHWQESLHYPLTVAHLNESRSRLSARQEGAGE